MGCSCTTFVFLLLDGYLLIQTWNRVADVEIATLHKQLRQNCHLGQTSVATVDVNGKGKEFKEIQGKCRVRGIRDEPEELLFFGDMLYVMLGKGC